MTMTRDKIAELLRQASATPDGYRMLVDVADVIALAERALEPQGQVLPELPKPDIRVDAFGDILPTNGRKFVMGDFFTPDQMHAYARAYASQLALPAGPVPEGVITKERQCLALWQAIKAIKFGSPTDDKLIVSELHKAGYYIAKVTSPAVAQPVADEREGGAQ